MCPLIVCHIYILYIVFTKDVWTVSMYYMYNICLKIKFLAQFFRKLKSDNYFEKSKCKFYQIIAAYHHARIVQYIIDILIPIHRAQKHRSSVITSKVIAVLKFALVSVAAILDLGGSRILPRAATPARAGSDIYSILPIQNHQKFLGSYRTCIG